MSKYPLATSSWGREELAAIQRVIDSGNYTMDREVHRFEEAFTTYTGSRFCVMVNSGSSANLLAVAALFYRRENPLQPGDEVIVPAISWPTTYYPLYQYGLKLKFVDIDLQTLNYDLAALANAIDEKTRLLVVVNLLGNPNDFAAIDHLTAGKDLIMIEDNCESLGASFQGKQAGTFGLMGTFSSFFSHHISTMEGGMVVTDDEELYHILLSLRAHGWTRNLPKINLVCGVKSDDHFEESFRFILPGYNVRPLEISGAIGSEQMKKLPSFIAMRRQNAASFQRSMEDNPYFRIQKEVGSSSWFGFSLIITPEAPFTRKQLIDKLTEAEIECRPVVAGNFAKNPVLRWFDYEVQGSLANAEWVDGHGFFVGNHHYDISHELTQLNELLTKPT